MRSKSGLRRTKDDIAEIREYRKVVRFAEEVMTGVHPRVKIPPSMSLVKPRGTLIDPIVINSPTKPLSPPPTSLLKMKRPLSPHPLPARIPPSPADSQRPPTAPRAMLPPPSSHIDFSLNYYKILGVEPHVSTDSIIRGYAHKNSLFSPTVKTSAWRWTDMDPRVREKAQENWERIENARRVLTDRELRSRYDAGRRDLTVRKRSPAQNQRQRKKRSRTRSRTRSPMREERAAKRRRIEGMQSSIVGEMDLAYRKTKVEHIIESLEDLDFGSDADSMVAVYGD